LRELEKIESILTQVVVEYNDLTEFGHDLVRRRKEGWSATGRTWLEGGKRHAKYTKLVDRRTAFE